MSRYKIRRKTKNSFKKVGKYGKKYGKYWLDWKIKKLIRKYG